MTNNTTAVQQAQDAVSQAKEAQADAEAAQKTVDRLKKTVAATASAGDPTKATTGQLITGNY